MGTLGVSDFLLLPLLATFFGLLAYFLGQKKENEGGKAPWKWFGVAIVLVGAYVAFAPAAKMMGMGDPAEVVYMRDLYAGKKFAAAIYGGLLVPTLGVVAAAITHFVLASKRRRSAA